MRQSRRRKKKMYNNENMTQWRQELILPRFVTHNSTRLPDTAISSHPDITRPNRYVYDMHVSRWIRLYNILRRVHSPRSIISVPR